MIRILFLVLFFSHPALAIEDSTENRLAHAKRYMETTPPEEMMEDMAKNVAMNFPPEERKEFRELMLKHVNMQVLSDAMLSSMVKAFTADELSALADFYSLPIAKSAMKKMGVYMADVMPVIQAEMFRAFGELEKAKAEKNRSLPNIQE